LATAFQFFLAVAITQEAIVADAVEAVGEYVEQEATNELVGRQGHGFLLAVLAIVLVAELHLAVFDIQQAVVGDGDAVGVASQVVENLLGPGKGSFGIDDPFCLAERCEINREGRGNLKLLEGGKEMQLAVVEGLLQQLEKQAAE
jgi:hypothetical protein